MKLCIGKTEIQYPLFITDDKGDTVLLVEFAKGGIFKPKSKALKILKDGLREIAVKLSELEELK